MAISSEKEARLLEISKNTLTEVQSRLNNGFTRVLVVRPTGFGKSYMLAHLTATLDNGAPRYNRCLYIYPTDVIKEDVIRTYASDEKFKQSSKQYGWKSIDRKTDERAGVLNDNTDFYSYKYLTNRANDIKNGDMTKTQFRDFIRQYDLIMLDECHRVGADGFLDAFDYFRSCISSDVHLVGVTATPYRYDETSIKDVFGERNQISRYTLKDAIKEGLLSKFDYIYVVSDTSAYIDSAVETINKLRDKLGTGTTTLPEIEELEKYMHEHNMVSVLKDRLKLPIAPGQTEEHVGSNNYAKFVVFMNNRKQIHDYADTVAGWFVEAFSSMNVVSHVIITKNKNDTDYMIQGQKIEIEDTEELGDLDVVDNTIDLIFCIDKLNMGYHVESITGVLLMGDTQSAVKYNQQIGRCFSVRSENKPIIFDIIHNFELSPTVQNWEEFKKQTGNKGQKISLPDLLDSKCVDLYDYTKDIVKFARKLVDQSFDKQDSIVWLYTIRSMPATTIAKSMGVKLDTVVKVLLNNKIELEDIEEILKHKDKLSDELKSRLEG